MELRSILLLACFLVFVTIMGVINYYDKVTVHGFTVFDYVSCDPASASCFVYCEEECDYEETYAKIEKSGRNVAVCHPVTDDCEELYCMPGENNCKVAYCTEEELEPGEICYQVSGPESDTNI